MSERFRDVAVALAETRPNMRASTLVALALAVADTPDAPSLDDSLALADWALRQPSIAAFVLAGKKIHAIRELRTLTSASLLQAKNAVDQIPPAKWGPR